MNQDRVMTLHKRPYVEKDDRYVVYADRVPIPKDSLFPDLEAVLLQEMGRLANQRNKTQEKILKAREDLVHIVIEVLFVVTQYRGKDACMAFPTSNESHSRKHGKGFSSQTTVILLRDAMQSLGWIEVKSGGRTRDNQKLVTTITPIGHLKDRFYSQPLVWRKLSPPAKLNPIVMRIKDSKTRQKIKVPYVGNNLTRHLEKRVRQINEFYSQHAISLNLDVHEMEMLARRMAGYKTTKAWLDANFDGDNPTKPIKLNAFNPLDLFVTRIFARDSFEKGGRHFGGHWQKIPKEYRSAVCIDGQPTIELDFAEFHPRILYAMAGETPPEGDLYDIWLPGDGITPNKSDPKYVQIRKLIKKLVNAWINDESGSYDLKAEDYAEIGMSKEKIKYRIFKKHPILKKFKGCGKGIEFQCLDSEIAERVIFELMEQGVVCLSIYDSFRVPVGYEAQLREAMVSAYREVIGGIPEISDPELPRIPDEMPTYPTVHVDEFGNQFSYIDQSYVRNYKRTHPHHIYLQGFLDQQPSKKASSSYSIR